MARHTNRKVRKPFSRTNRPKKITYGLAVLVLAAGVAGYFVAQPGRHAAVVSINTAAQHSSARDDTLSGSAGQSGQSTPQAHTDSALSQIISDWAGQHRFTASVAVTELDGDKRTAGYNAAASFVPASTYKVYVAYAVLHAIEQGTYTQATKLDDGNTIQADLTNMIVNSDNAAARSLGFLIGWKNINALLTQQGITNTDLYNYVPPSTQPVGDKHTTAADLDNIMGKLYAGSLLSAADNQLLLNLLQTQHYRERIPAGVPSDVTVADKPGWLSPADGEAGYIQNDAAIVYGPKSTYTLVIMTTGSSTQPLADLSRQIYAYLEK